MSFFLPVRFRLISEPRISVAGADILQLDLLATHLEGVGRRVVPAEASLPLGRGTGCVSGVGHHPSQVTLVTPKSPVSLEGEVAGFFPNSPTGGDFMAAVPEGHVCSGGVAPSELFPNLRPTVKIAL